MVGAAISEKITCPPGHVTGHFKSGGEMGKIKKGGFYWERELYQSDAFLSLSKNAMKILIAFLDNRKAIKNNSRKNKRKKYVFSNLDNLKLPYALFEKTYKVSRSNIPKALDDLLAKGFLKIVYRGGCCQHDGSRYALSDNYLLWRPGIKPFEIRHRGNRKGYQGRNLRK